MTFGPQRRFQVIWVGNGPIWSRNSYGFVNSADFGVSVMQKVFYKNSLILHFLKEWIYVILSFCIMSRNPTSICATPLTFSASNHPGGSLIFYTQIMIWGVLLTFHQNDVISTKMDDLAPLLAILRGALIWTMNNTSKFVLLRCSGTQMVICI